MPNNTKRQPIRQAVRAYYASRAEADSSCCGPADPCCQETSFYSEKETSTIPEQVASFSLGCGNAVGQAELKPGETVLDLGSGGGLESFIAARAVGPHGRVIGIDMTEAMIRRARAAAEKMGITNVEFREGLIEDLPVASHSIDVIISNCVINLSPDKKSVFSEMQRVLKNGGRIAISDIVSTEEVPEGLRQNLDLWSSCASGAVSRADWERGLVELGFEKISIKTREDGWSWGSEIPQDLLFSALITAEKA